VLLKSIFSGILLAGMTAIEHIFDYAQKEHEQKSTIGKSFIWTKSTKF